MRLCECGCGTSIEHRRPQARYLNDAHRLRGWRGQGGHQTRPDQAPDTARQQRGETVSGADLDKPPGKPFKPARNVSLVPQAAAEEMQTRLDQLAREFDRAASTTAMRKEGRALAKALGLPRPRWLPTDDWGSS